MWGFNSMIASWPGSTDCRRSGGCAATGCFYCVSGCVVEGYGIVATDSVMAVSGPSTMSVIPYYSVSYNGVTTVVQQSSMSQSFGPFVVDFLGSLIGDSTVFGTNKIVYNSSYAAYVSASLSNSPQEQNIGDIQSSSPTMILQPNPSSFIYDTRMAIQTQSTTSTSYSFANSGLNNLNLFPKFPFSQGGTVWSWSGGTMISANSNPGAIELTISTSSPISLTRTKTAVCPVGSLVSASGCFSCSIGSSVIITAHSTCSVGVVQVTSDASYVVVGTSTLQLTLTDSQFIIQISTSQQLNNFNLQLVSSISTYQIPVSFAAQSNVSLRNDTYTSPNSNSTSGPDSALSIIFPSWSDFTSGLTGGAYQYVYIIELILLIVAGLFLFMFTVWLIKKMCGGPDSRSFKRE